MIETHPFVSFVPKNSRYLIIGTFPGKPDKTNNWFYGAKKNQFWIILENVYKRDLKRLEDKKKLFRRLKMGLTDTILKCERRENTNSDTNLTNITPNTEAIKEILDKNPIKKIFFTSRFAEKLFFKELPRITSSLNNVSTFLLPSPSPRYALLTLSDKIKVYRSLLPKL